MTGVYAIYITVERGTISIIFGIDKLGALTVFSETKLKIASGAIVQRPVRILASTLRIFQFFHLQNFKKLKGN